MNMEINRRHFGVLGMGGIALGAVGCDQNESKTAEKIEFSEQALAYSIGAHDAPVIMQEFFSLTCSYCASFHRNTLPAIKEKYVDTGKLLLLYRDFPLDGLALRGHMLARSMPPKLGIKFYEVLLAEQSQWATRSGELGALRKLVQLAGMSPSQVDEALNNETLMDELIADRQYFTKEYGVNATPSFTIGFELFSGDNFNDLYAWIDSYLT